MRKTEIEIQRFQEMQLSDDESNRSSPAWRKAWKVEKSHPPLLNEIQAQTNYLLHVQIVIEKMK